MKPFVFTGYAPGPPAAGGSRHLRSGISFWLRRRRKQVGSNHALWPGVTGKGEDPAQWPADLRVQEFSQ
jgi:hypothetical protein